jgi:hypothetical protein
MGFPGMLEDQVANQIRRFALEVRSLIDCKKRIADGRLQHAGELDVAAELVDA